MRTLAIPIAPHNEEEKSILLYPIHPLTSSTTEDSGFGSVPCPSAADPIFGRKRPCILGAARVNYTGASPITFTNTHPEGKYHARKTTNT